MFLFALDNPAAFLRHAYLWGCAYLSSTSQTWSTWIYCDSCYPFWGWCFICPEWSFSRSQSLPCGLNEVSVGRRASYEEYYSTMWVQPRAVQVWVAGDSSELVLLDFLGLFWGNIPATIQETIGLSKSWCGSARAAFWQGERCRGLAWRTSKQQEIPGKQGERGWVECRAGGKAERGQHSAAMLSQQPWSAKIARFFNFHVKSVWFYQF